MFTTQSQRRFQCYCIGTGKTGTHSVAGIFARKYRAAHEPDTELLISTVLESAAGRKPESDVRSLLKHRDEVRLLELEADGTLYCFLDILLEEFPEALFLLTIRDCYTWLNSVFNHNITRRPSGFWRQFDDFTFAPWGFRHVEEEQVLADHGLRTLRHYLSHWAAHNQNVIARTPKNWLLVLRTDRIGDSAKDIAAFLRIPAHTLDLTKSHLFKNTESFDFLSKIDRTFLEENVRRYCGPLMQEYFPEIDNYHSRGLRGV